MFVQKALKKKLCEQREPGRGISSAGLRVCGFAGLRVCGFAGLRVCGPGRGISSAGLRETEKTIEVENLNF